MFNPVNHFFFQTWLRIGWQLCCQPIRIYAWKSLFLTVNFLHGFFLIIQSPRVWKSGLLYTIWYPPTAGTNGNLYWDQKVAMVTCCQTCSLLLIETKPNEIWNKIQPLSFNIHLKILYANFEPACSYLNVLTFLVVKSEHSRIASSILLLQIP